jgi:hypothetical protein
MVEYRQLEPSSLTNIVLKDVPGFTSSNLSFYDISSFIFTLFFVAIIAAAFWEYILAGVYRMEVSEGGIRKSKETFNRTTWGLFGIFALFLLIFAINKGLLTGDFGVVKAGPMAKVATQTASTTNPTPFIPKNNDDPTGWDAIKNDPAVRAQLASLPNGGISVNKKVCVTPVQTSCTTVGGLPQETISMLGSLRSDCSGTISLTGGTEAGHKSHGPGKSPVDISLYSPGGLEACIRAFPAGPSVSFCKKTYVKYGYIFCDENLGVVHWHVYKQ